MKILMKRTPHIWTLAAVVLCAWSSVAILRAWRPSAVERCMTEAETWGEGHEEGLELYCINPCNWLGCDLYATYIPTYGTGWSCKCAGTPAGTYCCHLVAGFDDSSGYTFTITHGECGAPLCSVGTCTETTVDHGGGVSTHTASCES